MHHMRSKTDLCELHIYGFNSTENMHPYVDISRCECRSAAWYFLTCLCHVAVMWAGL